MSSGRGSRPSSRGSRPSSRTGSPRKSPQASAGAGVIVCCRFRPLNRLERLQAKDDQYGSGAGDVVRFLNDGKTVKVTKPSRFEHSDAQATGDEKGQFVFDSVMGPGTSQAQVFEQTGLRMVPDVLAGYNCTIFAYGQTGSGKTHTMMGYSMEGIKQSGTLDDPDGQSGGFGSSLDSAALAPSSPAAMRWKRPEEMGIIPRLVEQLFESILSLDESVEFTIKVAYVEIYMERVRDLLNPVNDNLKIRESKRKGIYIEGVSEFYVGSFEDVMRVMEEGDANRAIGTTNMNMKSSRSHSVFLMTLSQKHLSKRTKKVSKLTLVDLAGSEKVAKTGAKGVTLDEAKHTNKSLAALGNVISALTEDRAYCPYRDSKLTRLLTDSLGGNSKTCLIVTCSPSTYNLEETYSTLRFGVRAKKIRNRPVVNTEMSISEYKRVVVRLKRRIKQQNRVIAQLRQDCGRLVKLLEDHDIDAGVDDPHSDAVDAQALYGTPAHLLVPNDRDDDFDDDDDDDDDVDDGPRPEGYGERRESSIEPGASSTDRILEPAVEEPGERKGLTSPAASSQSSGGGPGGVASKTVRTPINRKVVGGRSDDDSESESSSDERERRRRKGSQGVVRPRVLSASGKKGTAGEAAALRAQVADLEEALLEKAENLEELTDQLLQTEGDLENANMQIELLKDREADMSADATRAEERIYELVSRVQEAEMSFRQAQLDKKTLTLQVQQLREERDELIAEMESSIVGGGGGSSASLGAPPGTPQSTSRTAADHKKRRNSNAGNRELERQSRLLDETMARMGAVQAEKAALESRLEQARRELDDAAAVASAAAAEREELEGRHADLEAMFRAEEDAAAEAHKQVEVLSGQLDALRADSERLSAKVDAARERETALRQELRAAQVATEEARHAQRTAQDEAATARTELDIAGAQLESAKQQQTKTKRELADAQQQLEDVERRLAESQRLLEERDRVVRMADQHAAAQAATTEQSRALVAKVQQNMEAAEARVKELETERKKAHGEVAILKTQLDNAEGSVLELRDERNAQDRRLRQTVADVEALRGERDRLQHELADALQAQKAADEAAAAARDAVEEARQSARALQEKLAAAEEARTASDEAAQAANAARREVEGAVAASKAHAKGLEATLETVRADAAAASERHARDVKALREELAGKDEQVADLQQCVWTLEEAAEEERAAAAEQQAQLEEQQREFVASRNADGDFESVMKELYSKCDHNIKLQVELDDVRFQLETAEETARRLMLELATERLRVREELEERERKQKNKGIFSSFFGGSSGGDGGGGGGGVKEGGGSEGKNGAGGVDVNSVMRLHAGAIGSGGLDAASADMLRRKVLFLEKHMATLKAHEADEERLRVAKQQHVQVLENALHESNEVHRQQLKQHSKQVADLTAEVRRLESLLALAKNSSAHATKSRIIRPITLRGGGAADKKKKTTK